MKINPCKDCKRKPKEQIFAMGYSDKDDELYLQHYCSKENGKIYFPRLNQNPFTAHYINGQRSLVITAWNEVNHE